MSDKAYITPTILKWARESARMTEEVAASKASVSIDKLKAWENGISQPTINQAKTLVKAYKRPFALFFLPEIPRDFQPPQDIRRKDAKPLGTASIFIIREIQQRQARLNCFAMRLLPMRSFLMILLQILKHIFSALLKRSFMLQNI